MGSTTNPIGERRISEPSTAGQRHRIHRVIPLDFLLAYDKVSGLNPCNVGHLEIHGLKEVKDIAGMLQMH